MIQLMLDWIEFVWWNQWVHSGEPEQRWVDVVKPPNEAWAVRLGVKHPVPVDSWAQDLEMAL